MMEQIKQFEQIGETIKRENETEPMSARETLQSIVRMEEMLQELNQVNNAYGLESLRDTQRKSIERLHRRMPSITKSVPKFDQLSPPRIFLKNRKEKTEVQTDRLIKLIPKSQVFKPLRYKKGCINYDYLNKD